MKKVFLIWLIFGLPKIALAGLGGSIDAYQHDLTKNTVMQHSSTSINSTTANYFIHQLQDNAGNLITEYTNASGTVFALTWHGAFKPDLHQLLGDYFKTYLAVESTSAGRQPQIVQQSQVVVVSEGRLRNFHGKAYIPGLLPSNFSLDELN